MVQRIGITVISDSCLTERALPRTMGAIGRAMEGRLAVRNRLFHTPLGEVAFPTTLSTRNSRHAKQDTPGFNHWIVIPGSSDFLNQELAARGLPQVGIDERQRVTHWSLADEVARIKFEIAEDLAQLFKTIYGTHCTTVCGRQVFIGEPIPGKLATGRVTLVDVQGLMDRIESGNTDSGTTILTSSAQCPVQTPPLKFWKFLSYSRAASELSNGKFTAAGMRFALLPSGKEVVEVEPYPGVRHIQVYSPTGWRFTWLDSDTATTECLQQAHLNVNSMSAARVTAMALNEQGFHVSFHVLMSKDTILRLLAEPPRAGKLAHQMQELHRLSKKLGPENIVIAGVPT